MQHRQRNPDILHKIMVLHVPLGAQKKLYICFHMLMSSKLILMF